MPPSINQKPLKVCREFEITANSREEAEEIALRSMRESVTAEGFNILSLFVVKVEEV